MNTNSNSYTIIYATILVTIVAGLLAFVYSALGGKIEENVKLDTKKQILSSLGVSTEGDVNATYNNTVKGDYLINANGELKAYDGEFQTVYSDTTSLHVFECNLNGETKYVIPMRGAGLWGPIWGYVALNADKNTVHGIYLGHEGETPGLGAEIAKAKFTDQFKGKTLFDNATNANVVLLGVEKNGKVELPQHQVDGISGGTITSKGVDAMLKEGLQRYVPFLTKANGCVKACEAGDAVSGATVKDSIATNDSAKVVNELPGLLKKDSVANAVKDVVKDTSSAKTNK